jgi:hypothetical protein
MINIIENRRLWEINHSVKQLGNANTIRITMENVTEDFCLNALPDGEYRIKDALRLLYNPIQSIIISNGDIEIITFYDDVYTNPEFINPFQKLGSIIINTSEEKAKAERISVIKNELISVDKKAIRSLLSKSVGKDKQEDRDFLSSLHTQAESLRAELTGLLEE